MTEVYKARLNDEGRIVIPFACRQQVGLMTGRPSRATDSTLPTWPSDARGFSIGRTSDLHSKKSNGSFRSCGIQTSHFFFVVFFASLRLAFLRSALCLGFKSRSASGRSCPGTTRISLNCCSSNNLKMI
jgi:hypothetical protein